MILVLTIDNVELNMVAARQIEKFLSVVIYSSIEETPESFLRPRMNFV